MGKYSLNKKMKNLKYNAIGQVPKSNGKIVEI
jgi:hypothetical protein